MKLVPTGRTTSTAALAAEISAAEGLPVPSSSVTVKCPGAGLPWAS